MFTAYNIIVLIQHTILFIYYYYYCMFTSYNIIVCLQHTINKIFKTKVLVNCFKLTL